MEATSSERATTVELVSGNLNGAPIVEAALKTKAARKRVDTEKTIVDQTWI